MGRARRIQLPGALYHVNTPGNDGRAIVLDTNDMLRFLRRLNDTVAIHGWKCHTYCLMTTHYHALIETPEANLSAGMHWLNNVYAKGFNLRHERRHHVFGERFYSVLITSEKQLVAAVRYISRNPVEAGLCTHPAEWPWSNFGELMEIAHGKDRLLPNAIADLVAQGARLADAADLAA